MLAELVRAHRLRWTHSDELLALILETLDALLITTELVHTEKKKRPSRPRKPFRYKRPTSARRKHKYSTPEEVRRFFAGR